MTDMRSVGHPPSLYDFPAREYGTQGRWPSPDPAGVLSVDPSDPQTWNRYAYVRNSPLTVADPTGMDGCDMYVEDNMACFIDDYYPIYQEPDPLIGPTTTPCDTWPNLPGCNPNGTILQCDPSTSPDECGMDPSFGFTLGIRAPGQSFKQCLVANANNYSIGGAAELAANVATGTNTSYSSNPAVSAFTGNTITGIISAASGNAQDAASLAATQLPTRISQGMGSTLTYGRRTSEVISLNLAGRGGLPKALGSSTGALKSLLGDAEKLLKLGAGELKDAADVGLAAAEAIGCAIPR